jgi:hypothetical protein
MVLDRIDEYGSTAEILQHLGHIGMQRDADLVREDGYAVLGSEDEVDVEMGEGLGQGLGRPFRALDFFRGSVPRALPWATVGCPFGAGLRWLVQQR